LQESEIDFLGRGVCAMKTNPMGIARWAPVIHNKVCFENIPWMKFEYVQFSHKLSI
jgi:hypothetical protein